MASIRKTHIHVDGTFVLIVPSPDGEWLAIQNRYDAYLAAFPKVGDATVNINFKTPEVPLRRLTKEGANYLYWADGGKTLTWSFGNDFYRVKRDVVLECAETGKRQAGELEAGDVCDFTAGAARYASRTALLARRANRDDEGR